MPPHPAALRIPTVVAPGPLAAALDGIRAARPTAGACRDRPLVARPPAGAAGPPIGRSPHPALALAVSFALLAPACRNAPRQELTGKPSAGGPARVTRRVAVDVIEAARRPIPWISATVGQVEADEAIRIPARVGGVIQDISFGAGTRVAPGTELARVDPERCRLLFARAEAALAEVAAQLAQGEAALAKRRAQRERDPGLISEEELASFRSRVEEHRAAAAAARAQLELARKDPRDGEVRAGIPGVSDGKLVDTGQFVSAGSPVATLVAIRRLRLAFKVTESESVRLAEGGEVRFTVRPLPGGDFSARIHHAGAAADSATRPCLAWIDPPATAELRPGFFADVTIPVETRDAIAVPVGATLASDRGFLAWVKPGSASAESRALTLGLTARNGWVEVRQGIAVGERLIVRGDDRDALADSAQRIMQEMRASPRFTDVDTDYLAGIPEEQIRPDRQRASDLGVSMQAIGETVNALPGKLRVVKFMDEGKRCDVRVRLLSGPRLRPEDIASLFVRARGGELVRLADVVDVAVRPSLLAITRKNKQRAVGVFSNAAPGRSQAAAIAEVGRIAARVLSPGCGAVMGGSAQTFQEFFDGLVFALVLGPGAELRQPIGLAVIGGVSVSTALTLFAVPAAYVVLDRRPGARREAFLRTMAEADRATRDEGRQPAPLDPREAEGDGSRSS